MEFAVVIWLMCGVIAAVVASGKGRSGCGWFAIGFLLGPLGLILSLVVSTETAEVEKRAVEEGGMKKCPYCADVAFYFSDENTLIGSSFLLNPEKTSNVYLYNMWLEFRERFKEKYGKPNQIIEEMFYPYDQEDISKHLVTALSNGNASFSADWVDETGNILRLKLEANHLSVTYLTATLIHLKEEKKREKEEDW